MKKLLSILALLLLFALTLTACKQNIHTTHSYLADYTVDDDYHWFVCSGCDEINNKEAHTFDNNGV